MSKAQRIAPAMPPYPSDVQAQFDRLMPDGIEPLILFRTLANDQRLFQRFMGAGLLDKGHLSLREREIAIDRTTARCRSEYEWGVHIAMFAERIGLTADQIEATVTKDPEDPVWPPRERLIMRLMDELHDTASISEELWNDLSAEFEQMAIVELIMLAGFYHTVSFLTNGLALPLEAYGARFSDTA